MVEEPFGLSALDRGQGHSIAHVDTIAQVDTVAQVDQRHTVAQVDTIAQVDTFAHVDQALLTGHLADGPAC